MSNRAFQTIRRYGRWVPLLAACQQVGCLPDDAFSQVIAENVVFTAAVVIQSVTSTIFNSFFNLFGII